MNLLYPSWYSLQIFDECCHTLPVACNCCQVAMSALAHYFVHDSAYLLPSVLVLQKESRRLLEQLPNPSPFMHAKVRM